MRYQSTRNHSISVTPQEAVLHGLAEDGGLFVPSEPLPLLKSEDYLNKSYQDTAQNVLSILLDGYSKDELHRSITSAYDTRFNSTDIVPLTKVSDGWLMELWHGPTSAFKDIALTILPHLLSEAYGEKGRDDTIAILTATSGDTGKAALSGFADVPHTAITVFYPSDGVSEIQKLQMQTSRGNNVMVVAVRGNFDDCQRMVKEACRSKAVLNACHHVTISSANSINIGRLAPQVVYYFTSYSKLVSNGTIQAGDPVNFVVPTGNFGDILAGYLAKQMGLPVKRLICASNSNHVLTDFLNTGTYSVQRPFHLTMSPSMDILISSNLERLLYFESKDDSFAASCMEQLKNEGSYTIPEDMLKNIRSIFSGYWTDEESCRKEIRTLFENEHVLIDPHTAVAYHAMHEYQKETGDQIPCIVLSTASPYKFAKDVLSCISSEVPEDPFAAMQKLSSLSNTEIPAGLAELKDLPIRFHTVIENQDGISFITKRMEELSHD